MQREAQKQIRQMIFFCFFLLKRKEEPFPFLPGKKRKKQNPTGLPICKRAPNMVS